METSIQVLNKVRNDIELKLNEQLSAVLRTDGDLDKVIDKLDVLKLEEEICEKYNYAMEPEDMKFSADSEDLWASFSVADYEDYDKITHNLNSSKGIVVQMRTLDKLLSAYIIDTKQKSWLPLARNLQQCLISANDEMFEKSLRVHFKIISTPNASSGGYLNVIQTLILLFNSEAFKNNAEINETRKSHKRAIGMLKLILKTQNLMLKHWLHTKQKVVEEVMITFIYMLNYSLGNKHQLGALDFLAFLDSEAKWFKKFCYGLQTRKIILSCLKKTNNLMEYFIGTFVNYLDDDLAVSRNHRQFLNFSHSSHFLAQFLVYQQNLSIFPVKLRGFQEIIAFEYFVLVVITKINSWAESPRRRILVELLECFLTNHFNLILNPEIQRKLFEPFLLKNVDKKQLYASVETSSHILKLLNFLSKSPHSKLINNLLDPKKPEKRYRRSSSSISREKYNVIQIISNITIACIRNFINENESHHYVSNVIFELIDCCINLLKSHARTSSSAYVSKLVAALRDFYKTVMNHDSSSSYYKLQIATSLCFFIGSCPSVIKTFKSESTLLSEIVSTALASTTLQSESNFSVNLILNIAGNREGNEIISYNHDVLIKARLRDIWASENDEEGFMSGLSEDFELETSKLLHLLHSISYNFQALRAVLDFDNETTLVDGQERPLILGEIIENCLDLGSSGTVDVVLGLKMIKVIITNPDVLLHLQQNYKLQESLIELQVNSRLDCSDEPDNVTDNPTAILIDECSFLRHNILLSIKYFGRVDAVLNEKLLNEDQIIVAPVQSSSPMRRLQRACELQKFLHDSKGGLHDHSWLAQARRAFKASCKDKYRLAIVVDLIEQIPKTTHCNLTWPSANAVLLGLFPEEAYGVTLCVRFGIQNGMLHSSMANDENLILLLKQSRTFLAYRLDEFVGFDWFVAMVFLICSGNLERCRATLINIMSTPVASILWCASCNTADKKQSICDSFYYHLEIILQDTTKLCCALQTVGVSPRHIARKWLNNCFFSILDFSEICNFIGMAIVFPPEYTLFFIVAVFEHIKHDIFTLTYASNITTILKTTKAMDFHIVDYFNFMDKLFKQYKNVLQV